MGTTGKTWALILAAGEGSRLRSLTTDSDGNAVPKQFCSLRGGPSLLQETLQRAAAIAPGERTCTIVASQHRRWWQAPLQGLPGENVIVQPLNRGTAIGILLPLLTILARDTAARLVLLPADHFVQNEALLASALRAADREVELRPDRLVLLGLEPEDIDPELGYIVPGSADDSETLAVARFLEKPSSEVASELIASGGLWNAFIIACRAQTLLDVFIARYPDIVMEMIGVMAAGKNDAVAAISMADLYDRLPNLDFSRHVLEGCEHQLRVLRVPRCGWSDLGTPNRVLSTLRRLEGRRSSIVPTMTHLNIAAQVHSAELRRGMSG